MVVKRQEAAYLDLDVLLQGMRLLVASEADSRILKQLVPQGVTKSVILGIDGHGTLVTLPRILFVLDAPITRGWRRDSLTFGCSWKGRSLS